MQWTPANLGILLVGMFLLVSSVLLLRRLLFHIEQQHPFTLEVKNTSLGGVAGSYSASPALIVLVGLILLLALLAGVTVPWRINPDNDRTVRSATSEPCSSSVKVEGPAVSVNTTQQPLPSAPQLKQPQLPKSPPISSAPSSPCPLLPKCDGPAGSTTDPGHSQQ
jgi:hypothetical protein